MMQDSGKYLDLLKQMLQEEERAYQKSSALMFDSLCITAECFERT